MTVHTGLLIILQKSHRGTLPCTRAVQPLYLGGEFIGNSTQIHQHRKQEILIQVTRNETYPHFIDDDSALL